MADWQSNGGKIQKKMIQGEDHQHPQNVRPMKTNLTPKFQQASILCTFFYHDKVSFTKETGNYMNSNFACGGLSHFFVN